jgi:isochorismate synthase
MNGDSILQETLRDIRRRLEEQERRLGPDGRLLRLDVRIPPLEPETLYQRWSSSSHLPLAFWHAPDETFVAVGAVDRLLVDGEERIAALRAHQEALASLLVGDAPPDLPLLVGALAFSPQRPGGPWQGWHAATFTVPALLFVWRGGEARLVVTHRLGSEDLAALEFHPPAVTRAAVVPRRLGDPQGDLTAWRARVAEALAAIERGLFEKVVLARAVAVEGALDDALVLSRLLREERGTTVFALREPDLGTFLGATPERLFCRRGTSVEAMCLAGSARRGTNPAEDDAEGRALLASEKDRREHAHVVRMVTERLRDLGLAVDVPAEPRLLLTRRVQHLFTPVRGQGSVTATELLAALHPTPAVGGSPRSPALAWLEAHEGLERGLYAGAVGYLTAAGDADFWVAIRSALLGADSALAYAGCGIVAGSSADAEYGESNLKLMPLLQALVGVEAA